MDFAQEIKTALTQQIGTERYELWFADVVVSQDESVIRVASPTQFSCDRLRRNFSKAISLAADEIGIRNPVLEFVVDQGTTSSEARKIPKPVTMADPPTRSTDQRKARFLRAASQPTRGRRFRNFDSFVNGTCNQLARTSTQMVLDQPGEINPLVLYGQTGVGKSHLMEALWCQAKRQRRARVVYISAEQFTTYFVEALRGDGLPNFRRKYRQADVLIIDDIQFFEGKQATLVELGYTIEELSREHRQLILTSDRPPGQLATSLGRDIANRLSGGLVCEMKSIDQETMESISRNWAADRQLVIEPEIHSAIASRVQGDARQLSGVLNRLRAASVATQEPVTLRMANEVLYELVPAQRQIIRLKDVHKAVCDVFGVESETLQKASRARATTQPRMLAMYLAKKHTSAGLHEISSFFGRRSHSSAVTAHRTVSDWVTSGKCIQINGQKCDVRDIVSQVEAQLRAG